MSEILRSYTVRAMAADLLTDIGGAAGLTALVVEGSLDAKPIVIWGAVLFFGLKKVCIAGARLLIGDSPRRTHPRS